MNCKQQTNVILYLELAVAMSCSLSTSRCDGDTAGEKEILLARSPASYLGDLGIYEPWDIEDIAKGFYIAYNQSDKVSVTIVTKRCPVYFLYSLVPRPSVQYTQLAEGLGMRLGCHELGLEKGAWKLAISSTTCK